VAVDTGPLDAERGGWFAIKIGGELAQDPAKLAASVGAGVRRLQAAGVRVVVVHGGGPQANALSAKLGLKTEQVAGRRITDAQTLEVMKMTLGGQVSVDVARAFRLALESDRAAGEVLNVGSGESVTVLEIAGRLARILDVDIAPQALGRWRAGDIRHCFADITRARELLGYEPQVDLETGMRELAEWLAGRTAVDRVYAATQELSSRGLL